MPLGSAPEVVTNSVTFSLGQTQFVSKDELLWHTTHSFTHHINSLFMV